MPLRVGEDSGAKDASVAPNTHLFRCAVRLTRGQPHQVRDAVALCLLEGFAAYVIGRRRPQIWRELESAEIPHPAFPASSSVAIVDRITAALEPALGVAGLLDAWRLWLVCDVASPATEQFHQTRTTALQGPIDAFLKTESWSHYLAITRAHNCRDTLAEMGNRFAASAVMIGHRVIGQARLSSLLPQNALLVFGCNDFNYLTPFLDAATDRNLRGWYRSGAPDSACIDAAGQAEALQAVNSYMDKTVELNVLAGQRGAVWSQGRLALPSFVAFFGAQFYLAPLIDRQAGLAVDLGDSFFAPLLEGADNTAAVPTACVE
jgi:hypothetical protein